MYTAQKSSESFEKLLEAKIMFDFMLTSRQWKSSHRRSRKGIHIQ